MFIQDNDYDRVIDRSIWNKLKGTGNDAIIAEIAQDVIDLATGHINKRYDPVTTFARTGGERDGTLLNVVLEIIVYRVAKRLNPQSLTISVEDAEKTATKTLEKIQAGKLDLSKADRYPKEDSSGNAIKKGGFRSGGRARNKYRFNN